MPNEPEKKTPTPTVPPKDAPKPAPGVTPAPATAAPKAPTQPDKAADGKAPTAPDGKAQPQAGAVKPDPAARTPEAGKTAPDKAADPKAPVSPDGKAQPQAGAAKPDPAAKTPEAGKTAPDKAADPKAPVDSEGKAQPQAGTVKPDPAAKTSEAKKDADGKDAAKDGKAPAQGEKKPTMPEKPKEDKAPVQPEAPLGPAAMGPAGTSITKVLEDRLNPPSEKDKRDLPQPGKGETFSVKLHPGYLKPSKFNTFSVDKSSDDYQELRKSIELLGVKEPVLARPGKNGELEIISGQRRHVVASELNYPVPTIIAAIDDDDAKILVADSNIHREKITSFDLSRALRMKMDAMKHKAGRRRKGETGPNLNSDEVLAQEMGMTVAKLNRIIRLSEAIPEVCACVDDGTLSVSLASEISFLRPASQETIMNLIDINLKPTTRQIARMKDLDKAGKLTEKAMRDIIDDKDIAPKKVEPVTPAAPAAPSQPAPAQTTPKEPLPPNPTPAMGPAAATVPASPDVPAADKGEDDPFKGKQERPENLKIILTGDRLRKYFPDVEMTPREVEESIYSALEERRQRQIHQQKKKDIFKGPSR